MATAAATATDVVLSLLNSLPEEDFAWPASFAAYELILAWNDQQGLNPMKLYNYEALRAYGSTYTARS